MKKIVRNVILAALMAFVLYFVVYLLWAVLVAVVSSLAVRKVLVATMTTVGYSLCLWYIVKVRAQEDKEVIEDYKGLTYPGIFGDIKKVWSREAAYVYVIFAVCVICLVLDVINGFFFERAVISLPTIVLLVMTIFSGVFKFSVIGYVFGAVLISVLYLLIVLIYRNVKYKYWMK